MRPVLIIASIIISASLFAQQPSMLGDPSKRVYLSVEQSLRLQEQLDSAYPAMRRLAIVPLDSVTVEMRSELGQFLNDLQPLPRDLEVNEDERMRVVFCERSGSRDIIGSTDTSYYVLEEGSEFPSVRITDLKMDIEYEEYRIDSFGGRIVIVQFRYQYVGSQTSWKSSQMWVLERY
ncbi:MAG: hypothetical protein HWD92_04350 [Flavobacteriia bacterium]|nr:hypothetical protein [Flavobacteriia bacterium]